MKKLFALVSKRFGGGEGFFFQWSMLSLGLQGNTLVFLGGPVFDFPGVRKPHKASDKHHAEPSEAIVWRRATPLLF